MAIFSNQLFASYSVYAHNASNDDMIVMSFEITHERRTVTLYCPGGAMYVMVPRDLGGNMM